MAYTWYKMANNIVSFLVSSISSNTTNIIVNDWWIFPSEFPFMITVEQKMNWQTTVREIMKATARSGNTITVERASEPCVWDDTASPKTISQIAHSFDANSVVSLVMTAGTLADTQQGIDDNTAEITATNQDIATLSDRIDNIEEDISLLQNL